MRTHHNQEDTWAFVLSGTGADLLEARKSSIDEAEKEANEFFNNKNFEKKCVIISLMMQKLIDRIENGGDISRIYLDYQKIKSICADLMNHASENNMEYYKKNIIPYNKAIVMLMTARLRKDDQALASINEYLRDPIAREELPNNPDAAFDYLDRAKFHISNITTINDTLKDKIIAAKDKKNYQPYVVNTYVDYYKQYREVVFVPENDMKLSCHYIQGVATKYSNPANMSKEGNFNTKSNASLATMLRQLITGEGGKENITHCMYLLEQAELKSQLPNRIVLTGHSRGAATTLELAKEIYLKYGDKVKITMNLSDPVPGDLIGRTEAVVPPNVDSLVIIYASKEIKPGFQPIDINHLHFDPTKTTVTAFAYSGWHNDPASALQSINENFVYGYLGQGNYDPANMTLRYSRHFRPDKENGVGNRDQCQFLCMTDPRHNSNITAQQRNFLINLQNKLTTPEKVQKLNARYIYSNSAPVNDKNLGLKNIKETKYRKSKVEPIVNTPKSKISIGVETVNSRLFKAKAKVQTKLSSFIRHITSGKNR